MREPEDCYIKYCGYKQPVSQEELDFEILGLLHAIKTIEARVALLKQSRHIATVAINNNASSIRDLFGDSNGINSNKNVKEESHREEDEDDLEAERAL